MERENKLSPHRWFADHKFDIGESPTLSERFLNSSSSQTIAPDQRPVVPEQTPTTSVNSSQAVSKTITLYKRFGYRIEDSPTLLNRFATKPQDNQTQVKDTAPEHQFEKPKDQDAFPNRSFFSNNKDYASAVTAWLRSHGHEEIAGLVGKHILYGGRDWNKPSDTDASA